MKENTMHSITVDSRTLELMITGIDDLTGALLQDHYGSSTEGILHEYEDLSIGENALAFINDTVDITRGALLLINGVTSLLRTAFANDEAEIVLKGRIVKWHEQ